MLSDIKLSTIFIPSIFKTDNHLSYLFAYLNVLRVFSHDAIPGEIVAIYGRKCKGKENVINDEDSNTDIQLIEV